MSSKGSYAQAFLPDEQRANQQPNAFTKCMQASCFTFDVGCGCVQLVQLVRALVSAPEVACHQARKVRVKHPAHCKFRCVYSTTSLAILHSTYQAQSAHLNARYHPGKHTRKNAHHHFQPQHLSEWNAIQHTKYKIHCHKANACFWQIMNVRCWVSLQVPNRWTCDLL